MEVLFMKSVRSLSTRVSRFPDLWAAHKDALRRAMKRLPVILGTVAALQTAVVYAGSGGNGGTTIDYIPPPSGPAVIADPCKAANPHRVFFVPNHFGSAEFPSGSGGYYYLKDQNNGCDRWVVDIKMATYSNMNSPYMSPGKVMLSAIPYDLPGSEDFEGYTPITEEDCERLTQSTTVYRKLAGETEFTKVDNTSVKGNWVGGSCTAVGYGLYPAPASTTGWDTYRVAVKLKERSSAQEVTVIVDQPPPD
jgi:hypothetical protein